MQKSYTSREIFLSLYASQTYRLQIVLQHHSYVFWWWICKMGQIDSCFLFPSWGWLSAIRITGKLKITTFSHLHFKFVQSRFDDFPTLHNNYWECATYFRLLLLIPRSHGKSDYGSNKCLGSNKNRTNGFKMSCSFLHCWALRIPTTDIEMGNTLE